MTITKLAHEGGKRGIKRPFPEDLYCGDEEVEISTAEIEEMILRTLMKNGLGGRFPNEEVDPSQRRLFPLSHRARNLYCSPSKRLMLTRRFYPLSEGYLWLAELTRNGKQK